MTDSDTDTQYHYDAIAVRLQEVTADRDALAARLNQAEEALRQERQRAIDAETRLIRALAASSAGETPE